MYAEYSLDLSDFLSFQLVCIISRNYKKIFITFEIYFIRDHDFKNCFISNDNLEII